MDSVIVSHPIIVLPAAASILFAVLLVGIRRKEPAGFVRAVLFAAACACLIAVILLTLVRGGDQEEIVCYLLCLLAAMLTAGQISKGGGE